MSRHVCKNCGSDVELRGQYDANAPKRWVHVPSMDYRCLIFAEPYSPFGTPVDFPDDTEDGCGCHHCNPHAHGFRMFLCSQCGNKRCPHATHHGNVCTGSNDPGQTGSRY